MEAAVFFLLILILGIIFAFSLLLDAIILCALIVSLVIAEVKKRRSRKPDTEAKKREKNESVLED